MRERERELSVALVETVSRKRPILLVRSFVDDFKWQETKKILPVSLGYGWITWLLLLRSSSPPLPFFCLSFTTEHGVTSV